MPLLVILTPVIARAKVSVSKFATYPEIFSPDQDGYNDLLHITYKMEQADIKLLSLYTMSEEEK